MALLRAMRGASPERSKKHIGQKPGKELGMRAIFINAVDRKVEEVEIENKLEAFYEKIGCEMVEPIAFGDNFVMLCDEEGKLRNWKAGFSLGASEGIAGNALVVCEKSNGDFTDCPRLYGLVIISMIKFLDLEKTPLPPPAIGFAVISDLSPAGIEKARAEAMRNLEQNH